MAILTASYIGQSFGAFDVFSGVSGSIPKGGKVGLVGPNGIGKTTLLLILAGLSRPATGSVSLARGTQVGYLPQEAAQAFAGQNHSVYAEMLTAFDHLRALEIRLRQMEGGMATAEMSNELFEQYSQLQEQYELAGGYDYTLRIKQVLTGLGFGPDEWDTPLNHLSGGQKTRALLARLLLEQPDLLILDEPTNHLDVAAIEWLEGTLKLWPGALLLVSHDRYFLDKVVNTIWEMNRTGIESYRGNYSAYVQQRQARWEQQESAFATLKERLDKEMDFIRRNIAGQRTQMAQGKLNRLSREVEAIHVGGLDVLPMLRSKGWLQVSEEIGLTGRPAATVAGLQERINELRGPSRPPVLNIRLKPSQRSGHIVLRARSLQVGFPGNLLFTADEFELHRRECAALIGPNGSGKSTFLATILGHVEPLAGEIQLGASLDIAFFSQVHSELNPENSVLDEILGYRNMPISEARNYLAQYLFRGDDVYKLVKSLSGGERSRLALALLALKDANFLLLDEPTNHLDIPAQESLQAALEQFEGTILLVTHDRYLVNRLASQVWELRDGRLHVYPGDYQTYLQQRAAEVETAKATTTTTSVSTSKSPGNGAEPSKNERRRRAEALQKLEAQIHEAETKLAQLSQAIQAATQAQTFDKIQNLSIEYAATESGLQELMETWEELAHE